MAKLGLAYVSDGGERRLPLGVFDHWKGGVYITKGLARDADTGNLLVLYETMQARDAMPRILLWARRYIEWNELVTWPDGVERPRFVCRGFHWDTEPPFKVKPVE